MVPTAGHRRVRKREERSQGQKPNPRRYWGTIPAARWLGLVAVCRKNAQIYEMRLLVALIIVLYLVGVGVVLSPIIRSTWNSEPASVLAGRIVQALPDALAWPVRAARAFAGS